MSHDCDADIDALLADSTDVAASRSQAVMPDLQLQDDLDSLLLSDADMSECALGHADEDVQDEPVSSVGSCWEAQPERPDVFKHPSRKRGRPPGSVRWKAAADAATARAGLPENQAVAGPQPGNIEYARNAMHAKRHGLQFYSALPSDGSLMPAVAAGPSWEELLCGIGNQVQRLIASAFALRRQRPQEDNSATSAESRLLARLLETERPHGSIQALRQAEDTSTYTTTSQLLRAGCVVVQGASLWWGALLSAAQRGIEMNSWTPLLFVNKFMYDETPMKLRIPVQTSVTSSKKQVIQENTEQAKVMQIRQSIHMLFMDGSKQKYLMIGGLVPVPLQVMESGSAACGKACLKAAQDRASC